ncbi:hypothetical protein SLS56_007094 [Neofusicoccum ribis]|uniref:Acyl-CoA dehydrogenase n=1 Tax=Neofusicoccum ribis TaxID=45134 RepID=A0ABR3SPR5_9PEZI
MTTDNLNESQLNLSAAYLPADLQRTLAPDLHRFGALVLSPRVLAHTADAERNPPYVKTWDSFGRRVDQIVTSAGWRALTALGQAEGIVAIPFERAHGAYSRVHQFLLYHMWSGSAALATCPSAMTDGAARLLALELADANLAAAQRRVFEDAFRRLTSRDPATAWTSGQWMTERAGGSDVAGTETQAALLGAAPAGSDAHGNALGDYAVDGFKWFSSATDSQMAVLLARTPDGALSAFFAPMRRQRQASSPSSPSPSSDDTNDDDPTELNGIAIQRLKPKLGTRPVPTAELELRGLRAHALGPPGSGVRRIATVLNVTRAHNAASAAGLWGRGLGAARAFARVRQVRGGRLLRDSALHVRALAAQAVEYRGAMHLAFGVAALLGVVEGEGGGTEWMARVGLGVGDAAPLLRVLTPVAKALTARAAVAGLAECMEALGGVGYLENEDPELNVARLFRDANVLSIWEGTTNVMADDLVRVVKGNEGEKALGSVRRLVDGVVSTKGLAGSSTAEAIRLDFKAER